MGHAQFSLDSFGSALTYLNRISHPQIVSDGFAHGVAGRRQADGADDSTRGENGDISRTATNIDHQTSLFIFKIQSRSQRRRQAFVNQINTPGLRIARCVFHRAPLERRGRSWDSNHPMTTLGMVLMLDPANHRAQEFLRDLEIVDRTTPNWSMNFDVIRLPA